MIVVDTSALVALILQLPDREAMENRLLSPGETLHAPHLIDVETAHVLRRLVHAGDIDEQRGRAALDDLGDLPLRRYPHDVLLPRVWELRKNLTAHDGVYVALAEALDAPLITRDRRLASAPGHNATIEVV